MPTAPRRHSGHAIACVVVGGLLVVGALVSLSILGLVAMGEPLDGNDANPSWWTGAMVTSAVATLVGTALLTLGIVRLVSGRTSRSAA